MARGSGNHYHMQNFRFCFSDSVPQQTLCGYKGMLVDSYAPINTNDVIS